MNKTEVAAELECSTRQVEKYAAENRLGRVEYVRGKRGREARYTEAAVASLRAELERERQEVIGHAPAQALERQTGAEGMAMFDPALADALRAALASRIAVPAPSLLLTIPDAAAWLGVSKYQLELAIRDGKLTAPKIGRGRRVRPDDLLRLKDELFNASATREENEREAKSTNKSR